MPDRLVLAFALVAVAVLVIDIGATTAIAFYLCIALLLSRIAAKRQWVSPIDFVVVAYLLGYPAMAILVDVYPPRSGDYGIRDVVIEPRCFGGCGASRRWRSGTSWSIYGGDGLHRSGRRFNQTRSAMRSS